MACDCEQTLITSIQECIQKCGHTMSTDCIIHKTELECLEVTGTVNLTHILSKIDEALCTPKYFQATDDFIYEGDDSVETLEFTYCPEQEYHTVSVFVNGQILQKSEWEYSTVGKCKVNLNSPFAGTAKLVYWVEGSPTEGVYNSYELGVIL